MAQLLRFSVMFMTSDLLEVRDRESRWWLVYLCFFLSFLCPWVDTNKHWSTLPFFLPSHCQPSSNHLPTHLPRWHSSLIRQKGNDYWGILWLMALAISNCTIAWVERPWDGICNTTALTWSAAPCAHRLHHVPGLSSLSPLSDVSVTASALSEMVLFRMFSWWGSNVQQHKSTRIRE